MPGSGQSMTKLGNAARPVTATAYQLRIQVKWSNAAADFDVYLLDASGNTVASAASSADPETVLAAPTSGDYIVRVVPFTPLGQSYSATASLVAKPAAPPPGTSPRPGFANYKAPSTFTDANNAGEPSIGTSFKTKATLYQAYLSTYRVKFDDSVKPAKASWSDVSAKAANGCAAGSTQVAGSDPVHRPQDRSYVRVAADRCELGDLLHRQRWCVVAPDHGWRHPERSRPPDHRRRRLPQQRHRTVADDQLPRRRLLLQPGHRDGLLCGLSRRRHHVRQRGT